MGHPTVIRCPDCRLPLGESYRGKLKTRAGVLVESDGRVRRLLCPACGAPREWGAQRLSGRRARP
jgi:hypothetical protein